MKLNLKTNHLEHHESIFKKVLEERIPAEYTEDGMLVEFCIDKSIKTKESYHITYAKNGWRISGSDDLGLYYGIGKFLHTAKWTEEEFVPNPPIEVNVPDCDFRATYLSIHFYNWYYQATTEELEKYVEELLLWGYNTIICTIPLVGFESFDEEACKNTVEKIRAVFKLAKKCEMKVGIIYSLNQGLKTTPDELIADESCYDNRCTMTGKNICPSTPGAMEYMKFLWVMMFKRFTDIGLDYLVAWPYDEGGCGCESCRPWGSNGFRRICKECNEVLKKFYPNAQFIYATWFFDQPDDEGEFEGLYQHLNEEDMKYVDYIMSDSGTGYQPYVLEHETIKPILNFPEISMWGLSPWGGRGASPMPRRFQEIWDKTKHIMAGGMPYSEGLYEDISKIQFIGYYWDKERNYRDILKEYISYEYSHKVCEDVLKIMELVEEHHVGTAKRKEPNMEHVMQAEQLAEKVDRQLSERRKKSWRWRILYIRTRLDRMVCEFYQEKGKYMTWTNPWNRKMKDADGTIVLPGETISSVALMWRTPKEYLEQNQEAQDLLQELCKIYHCVDEDDEKKNRFTLPPVKDGKVL